MKLVFLLALVAASASAQEAVAWPGLPVTGFISGRAATAADVAEGRASFSTGETSGAVPIDIEIPQYAYLEEDGAQIPGVVLQAEAAQGMRVAAFRPVGGAGVTLVLVDSLTLLGRTPPE